jgi:hypothetical protein
MSRPAEAAARAWLAGGLLAGLLCPGAAVSPALAQDAAPAKTPAPDFSSGNTGWVSMGGEWIAKPGTPPPVTFDRAHPYVPNINQDVEPLPTAERPDF